MSLFRRSRHGYVDWLCRFGGEVDQTGIRAGGDDDKGRICDPVRHTAYGNQAAAIDDDDRTYRQHCLGASDEACRCKGEEIDFASHKAQRLEVCARYRILIHRIWILPEMVM